MLRSSFLATSILLVSLQAGTRSYKDELDQWRHAREEKLKADDGWLTVAGLFWLKEGRNTVGTEPGSDIALPVGSAPAKIGSFDFQKDVTTFHAQPDAGAKVNGKLAASADLKPDKSGSPDLVTIRKLTMFVIQRGTRHAIRLRDKNSDMRKKFTGIEYYPAKPAYRVTAKFVPYTPAKMIAVPNILGETEKQASPGYAVFSLNGHRCQLDPVVEDNQLFFIFKDLTSGRETYPPGRFLHSEMPKNGEVVLDFNKAYNPPCAFTAFATCPLPPRQNRLAIRIEAGERRYGH